MQPSAVEFLESARRWHDLAQQLASPSLGIQPPPLDWAVVVAFYAAVNYLNAYFLQTSGNHPTSHPSRRKRVYQDLQLQPTFVNYARLADLGHRARYDPTFVITDAEAQEAVTLDLGTVAQAVCNALGLGASPAAGTAGTSQP